MLRRLQHTEEQDSSKMMSHFENSTARSNLSPETDFLPFQAKEANQQFRANIIGSQNMRKSLMRRQIVGSEKNEATPMENFPSFGREASQEQHKYYSRQNNPNN